jgi:secreted PhoX family phosphatase
MTPVVTGVPAGDRCADDAIANPDNLTFLPGYGLLMVAEDTKKHDHAFLWAVDVRDGTKARVLAAPPAGEITGIHWIPALLGHAWLTVTVQHPWAELGPGQVRPPTVSEADTRAFTGYLGPFDLKSP